ncbi:MAG TPA: hypothetical protein VKB10_05385 [Gaiellaceae bacterium]|nr:hypothetical protein [Gaiellaceae bacterium]
MELHSDGRGHHAEVGQAVRPGDGHVGDRAFLPHPVADIRRFRVKHALRAVEDALILLDSERSIGVQVSALERIRDDLRVLLRLAEADCR